MRILHFTLGLPPYRSGGLTKYATDLLLTQNSNGDAVSLLYPGDYTFWRFPKMKIVKDKLYEGVLVYEIKNPTPVPLLHGVSRPSDIYNPSQKLSNQDLEAFYNTLKPEVFHIHTFMGLPLELVAFLKDKGVKIVLSSHDYYGLCPKVNFINEKEEVCKTPNGKNCALCNREAPSSLFLKLRNSKYLLKHKAKFNGKTPKKLVKENNIKVKAVPGNGEISAYDALVKYYKAYYNFIDCIHFNSSLTKHVYENIISPNHSVVIPISHRNIQDNRKIKVFDAKDIRLGFIGSTSLYKGFPLLKKALSGLTKGDIYNWSLKVWGGADGIDKDCNKIAFKGKYVSENLNHVFNEMDLLVVPSICNETFSLITLEALSNGVPVLLTANVGAKDIVGLYAKDFVIEPTIEALQSSLKNILSDTSTLVNYNSRINSELFHFSFNDHVSEIKQLYLTNYL